MSVSTINPDLRRLNCVVLINLFQLRQFYTPNKNTDPSVCRAQRHSWFSVNSLTRSLEIQWENDCPQITCITYIFIHCDQKKLFNDTNEKGRKKALRKLSVSHKNIID